MQLWLVLDQPKIDGNIILTLIFFFYHSMVIWTDLNITSGVPPNGLELIAKKVINEDLTNG